MLVECEISITTEYSAVRLQCGGPRFDLGPNHTSDFETGTQPNAGVMGSVL